MDSKIFCIPIVLQGMLVLYTRHLMIEKMFITIYHFYLKSVSKTATLTTEQCYTDTSFDNPF